MATLPLLQPEWVVNARKPVLILTYFEARGRADAIRLACAVAGIEFEDRRWDMDRYRELRESTRITPFGQLPLLYVNGRVFTQATAMLRYIGKLSSMEGIGDLRHPLYPNMLVESLRVDELMDAIEDFIRALHADPTPSGRARFMAKSIPRYFGGIERIARSNEAEWLVGEYMTVADLKLYLYSRAVELNQIPYLNRDIMQNYPCIIRSARAVAMNRRVIKWEREHMDDRPFFTI